MSKKDIPQGSLAYGSIRRWSRDKPKLLAGKEEVTSKIDPLDSVKTKVTFGLRFFITILVVIFISGAGALSLLGTTVLPVIRIDGDIWLVQRAVYIQGQIPKQAVVLSLGNPVERSTASRITLLFNDNSSASIVKIIASPLDKVSVNDRNMVLVNGESSGLSPFMPMTSHTLGDQYLGICLQGDCGEINKIIEIPTDYVLGKVIGNIRFGLGLGSPPDYSGGI